MAGGFGGRGWEEGRVPRTSLTGLMPSLSLICFTTDRSEANRREESTDRQSRSKKGQKAKGPERGQERQEGLEGLLNIRGPQPGGGAAGQIPPS